MSNLIDKTNELDADYVRLYANVAPDLAKLIDKHARGESFARGCIIAGVLVGVTAAFLEGTIGRCIEQNPELGERLRTVLQNVFDVSSMRAERQTVSVSGSTATAAAPMPAGVN